MNSRTIITLTTLLLLWNIDLISCEEPSFECLAAYSKSRGLNEPEFNHVTYDSSQPQCVAALRQFTDKIRSDIIEKMSEISTDPSQTRCINAKFTSDDTFVNNIIKGEALASLGDKEKSEKLSAVESFAEEFITSAISSCLG
ncbi:unnamed protein product [Chironomus riparius]|uniref:Uncharacterized protein n=1 Tax=Chironomus riparius TaxID=315576 RepID=A0A9N9RQM5_9DIPT|nr:unnamed protein product [Chironomus riparius]